MSEDLIACGGVGSWWCHCSTDGSMISAPFWRSSQHANLSNVSGGAWNSADVDIFDEAHFSLFQGNIDSALEGFTFPELDGELQRQPVDTNRCRSSATKSSGETEAALNKKARIEMPSPLPTFKVRKEKLGDRITSLQQLVSPFGKTDTSSVLHDTIDYIKFLHDQVRIEAHFQCPHLFRDHRLFFSYLHVVIRELILGHCNVVELSVFNFMGVVGIVASASSALEVLRDLTHKALERQLSNQQLHVILVLSDLSLSATVLGKKQCRFFTPSVARADFLDALPLVDFTPSTS
ncbi:hypothetical protein ZIOFF_018192 [Zingiber officinale]|uniref:BHLH domain-containing protein n=1 Tax=Zingiber officinale TaxID=94328 RepID=A0A8J5HCN1_ZINOF|nr:hypothetical protein ZIOFF_018192 [Zingiber officinale]